MRLNLGAADRHTEGFICVDLAPPRCSFCDLAMAAEGLCFDRRVDLGNPWPWKDSSADEILAYDVCEHIGPGYMLGFYEFPPTVDKFEAGVEYVTAAHREPAIIPAPRNGRLHFMNELWRVLKPGGICRLETPNAAKGVGFFQDPTHVSPYCLSTFKYFEHGAFARERLGDTYGITARFKMLQLSEHQSNGEDPREQVWKIKAVMEAVK
jgi:hypothetical protein